MNVNQDNSTGEQPTQGNIGVEILNLDLSRLNRRQEAQRIFNLERNVDQRNQAIAGMASQPRKDPSSDGYAPSSKYQGDVVPHLTCYSTQ